MWRLILHKIVDATDQRGATEPSPKIIALYRGNWQAKPVGSSEFNGSGQLNTPLAMSVLRSTLLVISQKAKRRTRAQLTTRPHSTRSFKITYGRAAYVRGTQRTT